jgi:hypothetical protein
MPKLHIPRDAKQKIKRAVQQLEIYGAVCMWCGYGYARYTPELEDEHFANHCPEAPEELKDNARRRLLPS